MFNQNYIMKFLRKRNLNAANHVGRKLREVNIPFIENDSHMVPVIVNDPVLSRKISEILLDEFSIFVQHINYPTVKRGTERLRITPTPLHTDKMIDDLVSALRIAFTRIGL